MQKIDRDIIRAANPDLAEEIISSGADWIMWVVFVIFLMISIILLSGHGSGFISGYNTASKEEKGDILLTSRKGK